MVSLVTYLHAYKSVHKYFRIVGSEFLDFKGGGGIDVFKNCYVIILTAEVKYYNSLLCIIIVIYLYIMWVAYNFPVILVT